MMHQALKAGVAASRHNVVFNPGYQHSQRLAVATSRAATDALGMKAAGNDDEADAYHADYRLQRRQIQADSLGLERWAQHDVPHQGLLLEIRGSLATLLLALDQQTNDVTIPASATPVPLLPALSRAESAFSNYSASLTEPQNLQREHYIFSGPVLLWWLLIMLLVESAILAWLIFASPPAAR